VDLGPTTGALNFANGVHPGGGFLGGARVNRLFGYPLRKFMKRIDLIRL
jgi:hypothetical protein